MNFKQWLLENDAEHGKELATTGFWGKQGAGCIILAKSTKIKDFDLDSRLPLLILIFNRRY